MIIQRNNHHTNKSQSPQCRDHLLSMQKLAMYRIKIRSNIGFIFGHLSDFCWTRLYYSFMISIKGVQL